jgi:hypothetical protein
MRSAESSGVPISGVPEGGAEALAPVTVGSSHAPILVGLPYLDQQQASAITAAIGKGLATGDTKGEYEALIADLNKRGGVLGHPVKLVEYRVDPTSAQAQYEQGACATFTQDNHVLVTLSAALSLNYMRCVVKGGGAVVGADWSNLVQADYASLQYVLQPDAIALDRLARIQADQFSAMGLFQSSQPVKVGVLYFDLPDFAAAEKVLEASLAAKGVTVADRSAFHYVASTNDITPTESQVENAVLKFRSEGITHVIGVETNAWLIGFFGVDAALQNYYPRYGYTSEEVLSNIASNVPAKALQGARFIGWWPGQDITDTTLYGPNAKACLAFMRQHGLPTDNGNQRTDALGACDTVDFVAAALTAGGEPLSRASLMTGARAISGTYTPTDTFQTRVTAENYDGVSAIRQGAWNPSCGCFQYTSGLIPVA